MPYCLLIPFQEMDLGWTLWGSPLRYTPGGRTADSCFRCISCIDCPEPLLLASRLSTACSSDVVSTCSLAGGGCDGYRLATHLLWGLASEQRCRQVSP